MEALVGAVAVDSSWDQKALENVVDNLLCVQLTYPDRFLKKTYYDLFKIYRQGFSVIQLPRGIAHM